VMVSGFGIDGKSKSIDSVADPPVEAKGRKPADLPLGASGNDGFRVCIE
jgi:hypothetical protein